MAKDAEIPKALDKGKGKAKEEDKEDKPVANGKKEDGKDDKKDCTSTSKAHYWIIVPNANITW